MVGPLIWLGAGFGLGWVIDNVLKGEAMYQCGKEIKKYHDEEVTLPQAEQTNMRDRRDANRTRLKNGLAKNDDPKPKGQWTQGSYAMKTMVQEEGQKYDIDDGAYFDREALKGSGGADKTAIAARNMVRDAVDDGLFKRSPKVKKNCVRVFYDAGYHVDIPVYRMWEEENFLGDTETHIELASADWKKSDPLAVTNWFNAAVKDQSPTDDPTQFRRVVRLMKKFAHSRGTWSDKNPSGFTISKLVEEKYLASCDDDEQALHKTMKAIKQRLDWDLAVEHPVIDEVLAGNDDPKTKFLREKLAENLKHLEVFDDPDCTKSDALRAWKNVFNDDFFEDLAKKEESSSTASKAGAAAALNIGLLSAGAAAAAVDKAGGGRFG